MALTGAYEAKTVGVGSIEYKRVGAGALIALAHMAGEVRYLDAAERCVKLFAEGLAQTPGSQSTLLIALERLRAPPSTLVLMGDGDEMHAWQRRVENAYRPELAVVALAGGDVPEPLRKGAAPAHGVRGWLCQGMQCLPPLESVDAIIAEVDRAGVAASPPDP